MFSTSPQPQAASFLSCVLPDSATVAAVHCRLALAATVDPAGVFVLVPHRRTSQRRSTHRRSRISSGSFRVAAVGGFSARCFKQIWKIGKVLSCPHGISCDCSSTVDFLPSPGKIFCLVSTLFGLRKLIICMNLNICIHIKLFPNFHNKIVHLFFHHFC
jgi:hypothetical protein